jgi:hypothetical protein
MSSLFYVELLSSAEAAGLEAEKVADVIKQWKEEAKPYGDEWTNEVQLRALRIVAASKKFAKLTVELAQEADKLASEDTLETKASVVEILAHAARTAGMEELAKASEARQAKYDQQLDEEYHHKVPPFIPTPYAGRQNKKADQVVLMELFTGAQCPPCVAADVAFDALLTTYKPAEFIGLQYHLHIPGPDPLTNNDSLARQKYYGSEVRGTPSTFFNGHSEAGGGGPMANAKAKYAEYREIIDRALEGSRTARIDLAVTRTGNQIRVVASASTTGSGVDRPENRAGSASNEARRVLRLALTEESIHYIGGNKLRFHHHVVRALPGGAEGKDLKDGSGKVDMTLNLADVKHGLEQYLDNFTKTRAFPKVLPPIKLDHLAVVAFVQDDSDQSILNAVSMPVDESRP